MKIFTAIAVNFIVLMLWGFANYYWGEIHWLGHLFGH